MIIHAAATVTSAFRRSAVRGPVLKWRLASVEALSPVPFGGVLFADFDENGYRATCARRRSPVPFGGVLFADDSCRSLGAQA